MTPRDNIQKSRGKKKTLRGGGGLNMKGTVFVGICELLYSKGDDRFQR